MVICTVTGYFFPHLNFNQPHSTCTNMIKLAHGACKYLSSK